MSWYPDRERVEGELGGRLIVVMPEPYKAIGLASAIAGLRILTSVEGPVTECLRVLGAEVVVVGIPDGVKTTSVLLAQPEARRQLRAWAPAPVLVFRPNRTLAAAFEDEGCVVWMPEAKVARGLENKRAFRRLCEAAGLPTVPTKDVRWPFQELEASTASPWVLQTARGNAGRRTWLCTQSAPEDIPTRLRRQPFLAAPLLDGRTWTVNAVVLEDRVVISDLMLQIAQDPRLGDRPFASQGVALVGGQPWLASLRDAIEDITTRVGVLVRERGMRGFFGLDFVGDSVEALRLIEMNARFTATLTAVTLAELAASRAPLMVAHCAAFAGSALANLRWERDKPCRGGLLIVRDTPDHSVVDPGLSSWNWSARDVGLTDAPTKLWPARPGVTAIPSGGPHGGPDEDRLRLHFSETMVEEGGEFSDLVEAALSRLVSSRALRQP